MQSALRAVIVQLRSDEQFNTDGTAIRGPAYGMKTIRVDGNDAIAVYQATKMAREYIVKNKAPVYLEAMTYRIGDHSTSDYSALYREEKEIDSWRVANDPIKRLGSYLKKKGLFPFSDEELKVFRKGILDEVAASLKRQSETPLPRPELLFEQVYDKPTENLRRQQEECLSILAQYPDELKAGRYSKS
jgi:2-oxoisovalerate dehydrogenase E1 component alpha subunit